MLKIFLSFYVKIPKKPSPGAERLTDLSQETALVARSRRTPTAPILPTLFGPFRPPKSRVHLFNNLFAACMRSVSVMTHIRFAASCLALPGDGSTVLGR